MIEKQRNEILELTQTILIEYWQGDQKLITKYMHPDILWIGSTDSEYVHGAAEMLKRLVANKTEMPPVYLDEQEYEVAYSDSMSCLVVGRYRAYTKPESGVLLSEKQRVTFLWVKDKKAGVDRPLIKHLHLSNILKIQGDDEFFPIREGKKNFESMRRIVSERVLDEFVTVKDANQVSKVFNYSEVLYLQADRNYTEFYSAEGFRLARVRGNLSTFVSKLPDFYLRVSRSTVINVNYAKSMKGRTVTLLDGTEINVPAPKCAEVRRRLNAKTP